MATFTTRLILGVFVLLVFEIYKSLLNEEVRKQDEVVQSELFLSLMAAENVDRASFKDSTGLMEEAKRNSLRLQKPNVFKKFRNLFANTIGKALFFLPKKKKSEALTLSLPLVLKRHIYGEEFTKDEYIQKVLKIGASNALAKDNGVSQVNGLLMSLLAWSFTIFLTGFAWESVIFICAIDAILIVTYEVFYKNH